MLEKRETDTAFIPARVGDNAYNNPEYRKVLEGLSGWQKRAWLEGDWDIAAGQFFTTFRRDVHVIEDFDDTRAVEWFAALDYGFAHYTVVLLGCRDGDGNIFIVDEHAERLWLPQRHAAGIKAMVGRHVVPVDGGSLRVDRGERQETRPLALADLKRFVGGCGRVFPAERRDDDCRAVRETWHFIARGEHRPGQWLGGSVARIRGCGGRRPPDAIHSQTVRAVG